MLARDYGRIVNIASVAGKEGNPNASAYSASKAAVIGLTKSLGKELAKIRRARQLRDAGGGQDGDLRSDDAAAHRFHAVEDSAAGASGPSTKSRRSSPGFAPRTVRSRPARCSTCRADARPTDAAAEAAPVRPARESLAPLRPHRQHDLADVGARFHQPVRGRRFGQRKDAMDDRLQLARGEQRPDFVAQRAAPARLSSPPGSRARSSR